MTMPPRRASAAARLRDLWSLLKMRQTALLVVTGLAAYAIARGPAFAPAEVAGLTFALLLTVGGCTALNMLLDRDVDAQMGRTRGRPLPAGRLRPIEGGAFGAILSALGLALAFALDTRFGAVVALGFVFDLLVYTAWLKRRTPHSILLGGVAGGMPVLAGRVLALGHVDLIGLLLAGSILLWIPSHILTLALRYADDYRRAGVPTWPNVYGPQATRLLIAGANLLNALTLTACTLLLGIHPAALVLLLVASLGMCALATWQLFRPTDQRNWLLFKLASLYMLGSLVLLTVGALI